MKGYGKMYSYRYKVAGVAIAGIGLLLWTAHQIAEFEVIKKFDFSQHSFMFWLIVLFGLITAAFSLEKNDDERVKAVRAKSMMMSFSLTMTILMAVSYAFFISNTQIDASALIIVPSFSIIFYHLHFNFGIYNDAHWDYGYETWSPFSKKGSWKQKSFIIFVVITALITGFLIYETIARI